MRDPKIHSPSHADSPDVTVTVHTSTSGTTVEVGIKQPAPQRQISYSKPSDNPKKRPRSGQTAPPVSAQDVCELGPIMPGWPTISMVQPTAP